MRGIRTPVGTAAILAVLRDLANLSGVRHHHRLSQRALFVVLLLLTYVVGLTLLVGGVALASVVLIVVGVIVTAIYPVLVTVKGVRRKR
ncbi:hypothetical protein SAMN04488074_101346 [Lentzea albidocapillata subsp. violacea]|uniref:Uncharacterized protein n=1 Tax=Lentzea albidocapillata subsp. violacea TaxID=128104 RepID=A0A1G8QGX6_9PSEU|nr:hypothetical protein [Lentzea albidocapillata]SDJ03931.1 hypothetical protein SAMN04488074_101346 [Lentzea albidocapillata subsp. violacea]